jgi:hypothetical protein
MDSIREGLITSATLPRLGGELSAFTDRLGSPNAWHPNWLAFSHGRAALAWLLDRYSVRSAAVCAYTCPTIPEFFRRRGIALGAFDVGATYHEIVTVAKEMSPPRLILLPALFGAPPWLDTQTLQTALDANDRILVDAAQTAFGHVDFMVPRSAVLSCPRKCTELADGAADLDELPVATAAAALKAAARALWATGNPDLESQAVILSRKSEEIWPNTPHRMSDSSRALLERLDREWHASVRRRNRSILMDRLRGRVPLWPVADGTPFSMPIFVSNRDLVLGYLHDHRIFATALWPDARHDPARHPVAAWLAQYLTNLPVDQRHDENDMERVAAAVLASGARPAMPPRRIARSLHLE